ncbi:polysaccharide biosynthesis C-terminal domain-containing protein [Microbacterium caowuchunii]|uniref:oligosaccharide flippase family protein n=1 Tax=Microbacterium caowuchunii TaxID=2614638 RepID=UPI0017837198|nr:polysaccharide biosynthesis C-terminal domain-containing protein [Microbacterium caowuchunii]
MSRSRGDSSSFTSALKNFFGNAIAPLAGLASAPILAHTLGAQGRGELAGATAPFLLLATIAAVGIPDAVTYFVARQPGHKLSVTVRAILLVGAAGLVATIAAVVTAPLLAAGDEQLRSLIILASLGILPTVVVGVLRAVAAGLGLWTLVAVERATGPLLRLALIAILAIAGELTVLAATLCIAYSPIAAGLVYARLLKRTAQPAPSPPGLKAVAGYGARAWLGSIAGVILMRIDQVAMVPLSSAQELGLYVVAVTIAELPLVVNTAIREVVFAADAKKASNADLSRAARLSLLVCLCIGVTLGTTCFWWIPIAFGDDFGPAAPIAIMLLAAVVAGIPGSVAGAGLSARGHPQLRSYSLVVACVLNVALVFFLVPPLGAMGAALATLVGNLVSSNINILQLRARYGMSVSSFYVIRISDVVSLVRRVRRMMRGQK